MSRIYCVAFSVNNFLDASSEVLSSLTISRGFQISKYFSKMIISAFIEFSFFNISIRISFLNTINSQSFYIHAYRLGCIAVPNERREEQFSSGGDNPSHRAQCPPGGDAFAAS